MGFGSRTCHSSPSQVYPCWGQLYALYIRKGTPPKWVKAGTLCVRCHDVQLIPDAVPNA